MPTATSTLAPASATTSSAGSCATQIANIGNAALGTLNAVESQLGGLTGLISSFLGSFGIQAQSQAQSDIDGAQAFIRQYMGSQMAIGLNDAACSSVLSVITATASNGCSRATSVRWRSSESH